MSACQHPLDPYAAAYQSAIKAGATTAIAEKIAFDTATILATQGACIMCARCHNEIANPGFPLGRNCHQAAFSSPPRAAFSANPQQAGPVYLPQLPPPQMPTQPQGPLCQCCKCRPANPNPAGGWFDMCGKCNYARTHGQQWAAAGMCSHCGQNVPNPGYKWCSACVANP